MALQALEAPKPTPYPPMGEEKIVTRKDARPNSTSSIPLIDVLAWGEPTIVQPERLKFNAEEPVQEHEGTFEDLARINAAPSFFGENRQIDEEHGTNNSARMRAPVAQEVNKLLRIDPENRWTLFEQNPIEETREWTEQEEIHSFNEHNKAAGIVEPKASPKEVEMASIELAIARMTDTNPDHILGSNLYHLAADIIDMGELTPTEDAPTEDYVVRFSKTGSVMTDRRGHNDGMHTGRNFKPREYDDDYIDTERLNRRFLRKILPVEMQEGVEVLDHRKPRYDVTMNYDPSLVLTSKTPVIDWTLFDQAPREPATPIWTEEYSLVGHDEKPIENREVSTTPQLYPDGVGGPSDTSPRFS